MKLWKTISIAAISVSLTPVMTAEDKMRDEINPWLDCGIGAMVFPSANHEVGAGLSNVIWDLGTTAVTSAMSSPETCNGTDNVKTAMFIERTYATLETELAKGEGENLAALAELMEVSDTETFVVALREEFASVVAAGDARAETLYLTAQSVVATG